MREMGKAQIRSMGRTQPQQEEGGWPRLVGCHSEGGRAASDVSAGGLVLQISRIAGRCAGVGDAGARWCFAGVTVQSQGYRPREEVWGFSLCQGVSWEVGW